MHIADLSPRNSLPQCPALHRLLYSLPCVSAALGHRLQVGFSANAVTYLAQEVSGDVMDLIWWIIGNPPQGMLNCEFRTTPAAPCAMRHAPYDRTRTQRSYQYRWAILSG